MVERPALSKGEMEVARILWELGAGTVREVHEAFPPERSIDFSTVQTYLRRLERKGYVRAKRTGRILTYEPRVKRSTAVRETIGDLVERLFGGDTMPLMRHLIEDGHIDSAQLAELRKMIDRLEKRE